MADSHPIENWRPVVGFEGLYEISDLGRVKSFNAKRRACPPAGRLLKPISLNGYPSVWLGRKRREYIHRLVLEAFVGRCPGGMEACHQNGDPADPRLANLRWDTKKGNEADKRGHGTYLKRGRPKRGERHHNATLSDLDVRRVFVLREAGHTQRGIAQMLGTSQRTVLRILKGQTRRDVTTELSHGAR